MAKYRKKPVVIEATQWFKNGDHPEDKTEVFNSSTAPGGTIRSEGKIVRRHNVPDSCNKIKCKHCDIIMRNHGWIDTLEGGHIVCPGDWVITGVSGEMYPCKPDIFEKTYDKCEE